MILSGNYKIEKLKSKVKNYRVISFDIFDTLLKRDVNGEKEIFCIIQNLLSENNSCYSKNFVNERFKAEKNAKEINSTSEVTLHDIYKSFLYKGRKLSEEDVDYLCRTEVEAECSICCINPKIRELMDYCNKNNKTVILTSDMYLSSVNIKKILEKCGIEESRDYKYLFVSSDLQKSKLSGSLYKYIAGFLKTKPKDIIHIGDAWRSDYLKARSNGFEAVHIPGDDNQTSYSFREKDLINIETKELLNKFESNRLYQKSNYYKFGYECLGPLMYGFSQWIYENTVPFGADKKIYFLSREGQFIKRAFNELYPYAENEYLYVSRKSLLQTLLWTEETIEGKLNYILKKHNYTVNVILESLGIDDMYDKVVYGKDVYFSISEIISDKDLMQFLNENNDEITARSREQFDCFKEMFDVTEASEIIIVDIGWNGTMQDCLKKILKYINPNAKLLGLYLGVSRKGYEVYPENEIVRKGYLFYYHKGVCSTAINENDLFSFCGLLESLFTADHGSVKKYYRENGKIYPDLYEYEYLNNANYDKLIDIQNAAIDFISDYKKCSISKLYSYDNICAFSKIKAFGNYPDRKNIKMFENFDFFDIEKTKMCGNHRWTFKFWKVKPLLVDFLLSGWKVGFFKKNFPFVPARKIFTFIRKF